MARYTAKVVSVLGRTRRVGRWMVSDDTRVIVVLGSCHLDLTRAYVDDDTEEISIDALTLFGSLRITVPDGSRVHPSGAAVFASVSIDLPHDGHTSTLPRLDLESTAAFSRVRVVEHVDEEQAPAEPSTSDHAAKVELTFGQAALGEPPVLAADAPDEAALEPDVVAEPPKMATVTEGIPSALDRMEQAAGEDGADDDDDTEDETDAEADEAALAVEDGGSDLVDDTATPSDADEPADDAELATTEPIAS